MGTIAVIIMVILFLILLAFVFSTALLTPIIGKKNLLFVIVMGFIVGIVGGAFFISPIFDDIPNIAASFYQSTSNDVETINLNVSTNLDIDKFITDTRNLDGVKSVEVSDITVRTTQFSPAWKNSLESRIIDTNKNITYAKITNNDTIEVQIGQANPKEVITKLEDWLMLVGAIDVKYSIIHVSLKVETSKLNSTMETVSKQAVVTSVEGPTQDKISYIKSIMPDRSNLIILCGFIGVLTGLAGLFIDTLISIFGDIRGKVTKNDR